ncbi:unnamed protein product, partial [Polarella glacialis]
VDILKGLNHSNIIQYYDFFEDPLFLYVVMEFCEGGELFAKMVELRRFSGKEVARIGKQILSALEYCHSKHIVHRDIKPQNFMFADSTSTWNIKIIDFGLSCKFKDDEFLTDLCGSPHYLAPELIGQRYNCQVDMWAFGVLIYLLMYGRYPFEGKNMRDTMIKIVTEPINWKTRCELSESCVGFMQQLLDVSPRLRMTATDALGHPWIKLMTSAIEGNPADNLPEELVRDAFRKSSATKQAVDPELDKRRSAKLQKLDEDWREGIRNAHRLGKKHASKPEFVR